MQMGEFKQEIIKVNNSVNFEVFGQGLRKQKVDVFQDKILIIANNNRVKVLSMVDAIDRTTTKLMDIALIMEFKDRFIAAMDERLGVKVLSHLKDYDPKLEISVSVTILERPIEELLPGLTLRESREASKAPPPSSVDRGRSLLQKHFYNLPEGVKEN
ncbi:MAG: DUF2294 domain-containing protein [Peptococcaceae bacterium]|jgi:uncharacterized protein YbcI|nr:DUF2294 domain-containing protein [Peptococcaceae bacterium]